MKHDLTEEEIPVTLEEKEKDEWALFREQVVALERTALAQEAMAAALVKLLALLTSEAEEEDEG